jgi:hypothetical protein
MGSFVRSADRRSIATLHKCTAFQRQELARSWQAHVQLTTARPRRPVAHSWAVATEPVRAGKSGLG